MENLEKITAYLESIHCPVCGADCDSIVIEKNLPNIMFFRCKRCSCLFYLSNATISKQEVEFLRTAGYRRIPFIKLDREKKRKFGYID